MAFIGWLCITALAMSFCMAGLLALIGAGDGDIARQALLIGSVFALLSFISFPA